MIPPSCIYYTSQPKYVFFVDECRRVPAVRQKKDAIPPANEFAGILAPYINEQEIFRADFQSLFFAGLIYLYGTQDKDEKWLSVCTLYRKGSFKWIIASAFRSSWTYAYAGFFIFSAAFYPRFSFQLCFASVAVMLFRTVLLGYSTEAFVFASCGFVEMLFLILFFLLVCTYDRQSRFLPYFIAGDSAILFVFLYFFLRKFSDIFSARKAELSFSSITAFLELAMATVQTAYTLLS